MNATVVGLFLRITTGIVPVWGLGVRTVQVVLVLYRVSCGMYYVSYWSSSENTNTHFSTPVYTNLIRFYMWARKKMCNPFLIIGL